jgi:hypothetical protein
MTGEIFLALRILIALILYGFLGYAIYILWKDLRNQTRLVSSHALPPLKLSWQIDGIEQTYEAVLEEVVVGRDPSSDCQIRDDTVSSRHARLTYHHNHWWAEDLQSTNGTWFNEEPLTVPTVIVDQDEIRVGTIGIRVNLQP